MVLLDVRLELAQRNAIVVVRIRRVEKLIGLLLDLIDGRSGSFFHATEGGERVGHEDGKFILADRLRAVEIIQVEYKLGLFVKCGMRHEAQRTHKLIRVYRPIAIHVKHIKQHLDLTITTLEEVLQSLGVQAVIVRVQLKLLSIQNWRVNIRSFKKSNLL